MTAEPEPRSPIDRLLLSGRTAIVTKALQGALDHVVDLAEVGRLPGRAVESRLHLVAQPAFGRLGGLGNDPLHVWEQYLAMEPGE